ncbi:hypothetical protein K474DRAFT_1505244 [Panus rudis PR-1116 ss-1]|nr:hypothetical protein K474DRAFT_1505244 [Panus rudis PR-1116 ss-1]
MDRLVPDHLCWDPNRENPLFLNQAAFLYAHYYQLQISVHRPFIPSPRKLSPLSFPSLAICTNAARSCTHVLDVPFRRFGTILFHKHLESRWHTAGRLWDVLYEPASVGDLPLPQSSPAPSQKRDRDSEGNSPASNSLTSSPQASSAPTPATSTSSCAEAVGLVAGCRRKYRESHIPQLIQGYGSQPQQGRPALTPGDASAEVHELYSTFYILYTKSVYILC